ncbi:hypothetical protein BS50DRAFT_118877 [Corynespora cassiicola Philippines]|uniref:Uncharacterized protein n=1 Tax=Corynespora cassiicola Philippines TaxID=1448308 RepID=A0A2T2NAJ7_CORCC|nr:hypothetical protein BS50DRAFT_118877 [Corynespora cassiicola Philippines]
MKQALAVSDATKILRWFLSTNIHLDRRPHPRPRPFRFNARARTPLAHPQPASTNQDARLPRCDPPGRICTSPRGYEQCGTRHTWARLGYFQASLHHGSTVTQKGESRFAGRFERDTASWPWKLSPRRATSELLAQPLGKPCAKGGLRWNKMKRTMAVGWIYT